MKTVHGFIGFLLICAADTLCLPSAHAVLPPEKHKKFVQAFQDAVDTRLVIEFVETEEDWFCWIRNLLGGVCQCAAHYRVTAVDALPDTLDIRTGDAIVLPYPCMDGRFQWTGSFLPWVEKGPDGVLRMQVRSGDLTPLEEGSWRLNNRPVLFVPQIPE